MCCLSCKAQLLVVQPECTIPSGQGGGGGAFPATPIDPSRLPRSQTMVVDQEKLAKLQAASRQGGKGAPRRKTAKKVAPKSAAEGGNDKKLGIALKKLDGVLPMTGYEEVNMFREDGKVIHFTHPNIALVKDANTHIVTGKGKDKEMTDLLPGIVNQLGPEALASLRQLAQSYQMMQKQGAASADDVPDAVRSLLCSCDCWHGPGQKSLTPPTVLYSPSPSTSRRRSKMRLSRSARPLYPRWP